MGFDWQTCVQRLTAQSYTVCSGTHCNNYQVTQEYHSNCASRGQLYEPIQTIECYNTSTDTTLDVPIEDILSKCFQKMQTEGNQWELLKCYCCCSCFANGTQIDIPGGTQVVEELVHGDDVLVASVAMTPDLQLSWNTEQLEFANGSPGGEGKQTMIYITYGTDAIVVTEDHLFLLPDGKLKRADRLIPVTDELVRVDGTSVAVTDIRVGEYTGGVTHIASSLDFTGDIDNHLLGSNGIVSADYSLQMNQHDLPASVFVEGHNTLPTFGTAEYAITHAHLETDHISASEAGVGLIEVQHPSFEMHDSESRPIPATALSFINAIQELDVDANATKRLFHDTAGASTVKYLFEVYNAFYPDVNFYLDWSNTSPNAYAFTEYGRQFIVIPGGLVRVDGLQEEAYAMIIAHMLAYFSGEEPVDADGMSCMGQAAFFGTGTILRQAWNGNAWFNMALKGREQLVNFFDLIDPTNKEGNPADVCGDPSIDCRIKTIEVAISGGDLPVCAGGETEGALRVVIAEPDDLVPTSFTVQFSEAVEISSAENINNYALTPPVPINSALRTADDTVTVDAAVDPATTYIVTVMNVVGESGSTLSPFNQTAQFTTA